MHIRKLLTLKVYKPNKKWMGSIWEPVGNIIENNKENLI